EAEGLDEDTVMEDALESGAEDFNLDGDVFVIDTDPNEMGAVRDALEEKGYTFVSAEVAYVPQTTTAIDDEDLAAKMEKLIDLLEDNDDVQEIWHNWEMPEE
ncbi:MAG: YebC/PmpR family DNA-binding transcriptional regulator, partial [Clostridia bacterium]|nr:YebC/PmpR family DNA-binding transcriptional regulator [Clostridia bacterium]